MTEQIHPETWTEIEYWCTQLVDACGLERILDIFSLDFMHEYTTFLSYPAMMTMLHVNADDVHDLADLRDIDTNASDACIAQHSEFETWRELVHTACDYYIAENVK